MRTTTLPLPRHLLEELAATQQNPRYHKEGSVLAHTELVVEKYFELRGQFTLSEDENEVLYWASVLHDLGKTRATRKEKGRWRSPGHERAGLAIANDILLRQVAISAENRRKVLDLVRWHGYPLRFSFDKPGIDDLKRLGTRTDLRLLSIFSIFDFNGRECEEKTEVLRLIGDFHEFWVPKVEYELGGHSEIQGRYAAWNIRHKNAVWNALNFENLKLLEKLLEAGEKEQYPTMGKRAVLAIGPPLVGKTTWLEKHFADSFVLNLDEFGFDPEHIGNPYYIGRKMVEFRHLLTVYLARHKTVIIESRSLQPELRGRIGNLLRELNIEVNYLVFEAALSELLKRNASLEKPLEEQSIRREYMEMELIHPWEAHKVEFVVA